MATEKNITMKQFNGTDYDTLYPKTIASQIPDVYSKTEVLTTETLSKYGLTADKLPNDVFQQIKTLIDNVQASADSKARIQTGSYVGTGTYGAGNPCSLTFDFKPKIVFIQSELYDGSGNRMPFPFTAIYGIQSSSTNVDPIYHFVWKNKTLKYYSDRGNPAYWMNGQGYKYFYVGIG